MELEELVENWKSYCNIATGKFDLIPPDDELQEAFKFLREYLGIKKIK